MDLELVSSAGTERGTALICPKCKMLIPDKFIACLDCLKRSAERDFHYQIVQGLATCELYEWEGIVHVFTRSKGAFKVWPDRQAICGKGPAPGGDKITYSERARRLDPKLYKNLCKACVAAGK